MRLRGEVKPELTSRELEIIRLVAHGDSNKAISQELGIEVQTVKNYLSRLMDKLGTRNRVQLVLKYWGIGSIR